MELGNPNLKSFRQVYIRRVLVDMGRVYVHREIKTQAEELLSRAIEYGIDLSDNGLPNYLIGYDPDGNDAQRLGLYIELPTDRELEGIEEGIGWTRDGNKFFYDLDAKVDIAPSYQDQTYSKIGARELSKGDTGTDVQFINLYAGLESKETLKEYDDDTADAVGFIQSKLGIPVNGKMDKYTWASIIPNTKLRISSGHAGPRVRALQAALICEGYSTPISSRFGIETLREVRKFQEDNGLRVTGRCGLEEWNLLFDYV